MKQLSVAELQLISGGDNATPEVYEAYFFGVLRKYIILPNPVNEFGRSTLELRIQFVDGLGTIIPDVEW